MNPINELQLYSLCVGFVLPPLLAIIQQWNWSNQVRSFVAFLASLLASAGTVYFTDPVAFTVQSYATSFLLVFVTAITTYRNFWKPMKVAPEIERLTTMSDNPNK